MANAEMDHDSRDYALLFVAAVIVLAALLWLAGAASAVLADHRVPRHRPFAGLAALGHLADPSLAWHGQVGAAPLYWTVTALVFLVPGVIGWLLWRTLQAGQRRDGP